MSEIRKPLTVVELEQPRCVHRFGEGACTATGTKCYNVIGTCGDLPNYDGSGSIRWRFMDGRPGVYDFSDYSDPDNPAVGAIPVAMKVSTSENEINAGSNLEGKSPLGITGRVTVSFTDFISRDQWGDFYLADRPGYVAGRLSPERGPFWALWTARNPLFNDMFLRVYDGYEGQTLDEMRHRVHILDSVSGPNSDGGVSLTGLDPLRLASDNRAKFPRASVLDLFGDLDDASFSVKVLGLEADVSDTFGNAVASYIKVGSEIIQYTGYTDQGDGVYALTGVLRGVLGTTADSHSDGDSAQRVGRYDAAPPWEVLNDLLSNHTEMPAEFIPYADWVAECERYIPTFKVERTIAKPTDVDILAGQLTQQGLFYVWWSEYDREVKLLTIRPPDEDPPVLTDEADLMKGSVLTRDTRSRLSQVSVFYNLIDPLSSETSDTNYENQVIFADGDNTGEVRTHEIYAPWLRRRTQAVQLAARLLTRYKTVPQFLEFMIDAKDREILTGDVLEIETRSIRTTEGEILRRRWQVISAKEVKAGHSYKLKCQTFEYVGRFAHYAADSDPADYTLADEAQRKAVAFYADDDGTMQDGTEGYLYQ